MAGRLKATFIAAAAAGAGAVLKHFLDPQMGRTRRAKSADQAAARARRAADEMRKKGTMATDKMQGTAAKAVSSAIPREQPNEPTLQHKVESEVLGNPRFDKGRVNVNAEGDRVVLRGELDSPDEVNALEAAVRQVDGVGDVENLVHVRGS